MVGVQNSTFQVNDDILMYSYADALLTCAPVERWERPRGVPKAEAVWSPDSGHLKSQQDR